MRTNPGTRRTRAGRRGAALLYAALISVAIAGMCIALLTVNLATGKSRVHSQNAERSFYAAEAGLSDALVQLQSSLLPWPDPVTSLGTADDPIPFGTSSYWVELEAVDSHSVALRSTGIDGLVRERLLLVLSEAPTGFFQYAAFGADGVVLNSNSMIDSYDSKLGPYDTQVKGGNDFALEHGNVGSNKDITLKSNTEIHGDATPGPGHVVYDTAPGAYVSGSTAPATEPFEFIEIVPPDDTTWLGTKVASADLTVGPDVMVHYKSLKMSGAKLTIVGPATVVLDEFELKGGELAFDTTLGPVELYGTGDFVLKSGSTVTTNSDSALDVTLLLSANNMSKMPPDKIELASNSQFVGAIYAPNANVKLNSNFTIYGSIMCGYLDFSSNGKIHFDEALLYDGWGATDDFEPRLWRRLPPE